jgi:hypothetical protein
MLLMPCTKHALEGGGHAIVCTRGQQPRQRCAVCGEPADYLCDGNASSSTGTCDAPLCARCRVRDGPDRDLCPSCAARGDQATRPHSSADATTNERQDPRSTETTFPARLASLSAVELFGTDAEAVEHVLVEIETAARSIVPDITSDKGRRAVASLANKVARSKTFLDELGKQHVADLKRQAGAVDAKRRTIRERLDALKVEVRAPLTEYERAEAARVAAIRLRIAQLQAMPPDLVDDADSAALAAHIQELEAIEIGDDFAELADEARQVQAATLYALGRRLEETLAREQAEAKAEAERRERAERERHEREARIAAEAAERAKREAEAAAALREAEAKAAAEAARRRIQAAADAAERRAREAEEKQKRAEAEAKAAAARAEREAAEAAEHERRRIAAEQAREREEAARRAADREHRAGVNRTAADALVAHVALDADQARAVVAAIARGQIPAVNIAY